MFSIYKKIVHMLFGSRYETRVPSPYYSAEEMKKVILQFKKDKEEYFNSKTEELRKQNCSCCSNNSLYSDERVINALEKSYELEKICTCKKD